MILNVRFFLVFYLLFISFLHAQVKMPDRIVFGAIYNLFHEQFITDKDFFNRVDRDILNMKNVNLNTVMVFPMNQWDKQTKKLLWTRTDYLVKKIEQHDLKLVPLMFKEEQGRHYLPIWKFKEIPGLWDQHNTGGLNSRENADHQKPEIRQLIEEYFKAVIERYGKSPSMLMYNSWNEPHYMARNETTVKKFREWLKEKYRNLDGVGHAWGEDYTDWEQVSPWLNDNWDSAMPQIDWKLFIYSLNSSALQSFNQSIKKYDAQHPLNANPVGTVWTNYDIGSRYTVDNWPIAAVSDIHGISHYADIWERNSNNKKETPFYRHSFVFNHARSAASAANVPWIISELQTNGQNGLAQNGWFDYDHLSLISWAAFANNSKGILYWKWSPFMRGRQSFGRGLTQTDGQIAPRGHAVKDIGGIIQKHSTLLYEANVVPAETAILLDIVGLHKSEEPGGAKAPHYFMRESYEGTYKALWNDNIAVDILRMDQKISIERLKKYKIIFLPFQIVLKQEMGHVLKHFVEAGGWLVADARTAIIDELDFGYEINPGAGLDRLFGVKREDYTGSSESFPVRLNGNDLWKGLDVEIFDGIFYREKWKISENTQVLATFENNEEPALTVNNFGEGKAFLSAVPLGAGYHYNRKNPVNKVITHLIKKAAVIPAIKWKSENNTPTPFANLHRAKNKWLAYLINYNELDLTGSAEILLESGSKVHRIFDLVSESDISFEQHENYVKIDLKISKKKTRILLIE